MEKSTKTFRAKLYFEVTFLSKLHVEDLKVSNPFLTEGRGSCTHSFFGFGVWTD